MVKKFVELEAQMSAEARQRVARRVECELKKIEKQENKSAYETVMPETHKCKQPRATADA